MKIEINILDEGEIEGVVKLDMSMFSQEELQVMRRAINIIIKKGSGCNAR